MTLHNTFDRCGAYSGLPIHLRKEDTLTFTDDNSKKSIKMAKTRAAILLVLIIFIFALAFCPNDAYPAVESTDSDVYHLNNDSRLVITNIVKTIEFEVGVVDDDDVSKNNFTSFNNSDLYETDIQLLNPNLLKELVDKATEETKAEKNGETTEKAL